MALLLVGCFAFTASGLAQSGAIQFSQADYTVNEDAGSVTLRLDRVDGSNGESVVDLQTFNGTAAIGDDYLGIESPLTVTWANGVSSSKMVTLSIYGDALVEGDKTFTMTIASANPSWVGTPSTATVTITEPGPGEIPFASPTYVVNEADGSLNLQLERVGGDIGELTVEIQTFDGTATIGSDYGAIIAPITLPWGDGNTTPKTITVPIFEDAIVEGDETFTVNINSTNPAWVGTPSIATVTIIDNDSGGGGCEVTVVADAGPDQTVCGNNAVAIAAIANDDGMWS